MPQTSARLDIVSGWLVASTAVGRAGGTGLISGRKAFQKPMTQGVELLNRIQDVYLDDSITIA